MNGIRITRPDGTQDDMYIPHPLQQAFHERTEPNVLFWGGRGSGKSLALRMEAHARAISHPGFTYIVLRRTYPELQRSHLVHIQSEMQRLGGTFHYTDRVALYPNGSKGFYAQCQGEDDVLKLLSAEFVAMYVDELSTFEWDMFTRLAASVRVPKDSGLTAMVRAATNPLGPSAPQIMRYFVNKDVDPEEDPDYFPADWYAIHANAVDNPSLDLTQYKKRFSGLPAHVRKAWVEGEFADEKALFDFHPMKRVEQEDGTIEAVPYHVIPELDVQKLVQSATIYRAFDMGYSPDPAYCLWIAHLGTRYIAFHEQLWVRTIVSDIAKDMLLMQEELGVSKIATTLCDPTLAINTGLDVRSMKDAFESAGVPMDCSINNREHFASAVHTALAEEASPGVPRLQIFGPGCPYLVKAIPMMQFNPKRPLAMADHRHDHPVVTLAYFLISNAAMERQDIPTLGSGRPWMKPKAAERFVLGKESVRDV